MVNKKKTYPMDLEYAYDVH